GRAQEGQSSDRRRSRQARRGPQEALRGRREHPPAGRVVRPVVRLRAPHPQRVGRDAARPRRSDAQEELHL
ncbi:MAG: Transcriptional regulator, partial [uncultured Frankineae bacterium]